MAKESPQPGRLMLSEGLPVEPEDIADEAGVEIEDVHKALGLFEKQQMIHYDGDVLVVTNWEQRQFSSDSSTERVNRYRANKRNVSATLQQRYSNSNETPPDTDTDTDIYTRLSNDNLDASRVAPVEPTKPPQNQASEDKEDKPDLSPPNGKELIAELVDMYRGIEGVTPTKGDYPFMGALYNEYGYAEVAAALNELTMVMATEKIEKPLVYLKAILRKADRASPGPNKNRRMHGEVKANADPTREYKFKSLSAAE